MSGLKPNELPSVALKQAVRGARIEEALKSDAEQHVREIAYGRLLLLQDYLNPALNEIPAHIDLFDIGIVPSENPRLFIDMISFVEMAKDKKTYRFLLDQHHGRKVMLETSDMPTMGKFITEYIARRLVAREKLLEIPVDKIAIENFAHPPIAPEAGKTGFFDSFPEQIALNTSMNTVVIDKATINKNIALAEQNLIPIGNPDERYIRVNSPSEERKISVKLPKQKQSKEKIGLLTYFWISILGLFVLALAYSIYLLQIAN